MEKSDSNIGLFFCSHSRPNSSERKPVRLAPKDERRMSEGLAKESRRAGTAEYVKPVRLAPKESRRAGTAEYVTKEKSKIKSFFGN